MKIKNVKGSSKVSPKPPQPFTSWKQYWEVSVGRKPGFEFAGVRLYSCPFCGNVVDYDDIVGGHVMKVNSLDKKWYILPICDRCNKQPDLEAEVTPMMETLVEMPSNA